MEKETRFRRTIVWRSEEEKAPKKIVAVEEAMLISETQFDDVEYRGMATTATSRNSSVRKYQRGKTKM